MKPKGEFDFEMRQAEDEKVQTALDLGLKANAGWTEIHREKDRLKLADELGMPKETEWPRIHEEVSRLAVMKRKELNNAIQELHAIQLRLPEESTLEQIADKMLGIHAKKRRLDDSENRVGN